LEAKLLYADVYTLTEAAAGIGTFQQWRVGDVYDPDYTGVGHQPQYFDQLCGGSSPYSRFIVPKSQFVVRVTNVSSYPVFLSLYASNYATTPASRVAAAERPCAMKALLAPAGSAMTTHVFRYKANIPAILGEPLDTVIAHYQGSSGASSEVGFLTLCAYGVGGVGSVVVQFDGLYHARFQTLINTGSS